ncbi:SH3 domain-containing protein [Flavobacterium gilvum]|uniref:SH3b domain-containing protein n=1 Tax=Flavobacterium gilvum TaxID=1492737 RepID=A0AAC9I5W5_9FLAO|nr:SH3 domain-containing protein [Flavobacterium gilvum]AOW11014.1 hypothetical protein EM308_16820 [Flavobacterium gilvum]KFC59191.1 hypothetical protein FEM08_20520 [Flavobacterium gilvum]
MKQCIFFFFILICSFTTYSQNYYKEGDKCFEEGDYTCAETKYKELYKSAASETDMQFGEIKIQRAKLCKDNLKIANQEFASLNYAKAKEKYQAILDSNPKDVYAKSQIDKCDTKINEAETTRLNNTSTPTSVPTGAPKQSNSKVTKTDILKREAKMRESDSPFAKILYVLPAGKQVNIKGKTSSDYYKVEYNGKIGYINEVYFMNSEPIQNTDNPTTSTVTEPEPTITAKPKKLPPFSSLGIHSGEIAKYGLLYESGGNKTVGFHISARTSFTPEEDILNGSGIENKTEIELGPNFRLSNRLYLNIGAGYGYYDKVIRNDYAGTLSLEKTGYLVTSSGLMIRINRVININGGVSFMDIYNAFYKPEITFGVSFNLKK